LRLPNWFRNFVKVSRPRRMAKKEERASELVGWGHSGGPGQRIKNVFGKTRLFYIGQHRCRIFERIDLY
jgi:hypothetical protein